jgi:fucose 4-O-acetylase-like acetyltransferase
VIELIYPLKRDDFLDLIKGIAISLVILGHCIQYGSGTEFLSNQSFFYNPIFKIIYSFHMPLFMSVSGYLFYYSIQKYSTKELEFSRITKLIIPIFAWNGLYYIAYSLHHRTEIVIHTEIIAYLTSSFYAFWFLWALFYCSMTVIIINKFFKDSLIMYTLVFIATFIIPDWLGSSTYKFLYPFFVAAYLYNKYQQVVNDKLLLITYETKLITTFLVYISLMYFYNYNSYIYTSGFTIVGKPIITQIEIDLNRLVIGFAGCLLILYSVKYITKKELQITGNSLQKLGRSSLGIYIVSSYIFDLILTRFTHQFHFSYGIVFSEAIILILISYIIINIIRRLYIANKILFGGKYDDYTLLL